MKKHKQTLRITSALMALALMAVLAGCGGGGGGAASSTATAPSYGRVGMAVDFGSSVPARLAAIAYNSDESYLDNGILYQGCGDFSDWYEAAEQTTTSDTDIPVAVYVTEDAESLYNSPFASTDSQTGDYYGPIASACTSATRDTSSQRVTFRSSGSFEIRNVLAGTNHLLEAKAFTGDSYGIYVAVVVPSVEEGLYTTGVVASPETTLGAAAAIKYAYTSQLALSEVDDADIAAINDAVDALFPSGFQYGVAVTPTGLSSVTFTDYSSFNTAYATGTTLWVDYVIEEAGLATGTTPVTPAAPKVVSFTPADGATNVNYDQGVVFRVAFDMAMDTTITPSGFSLTIQSSQTGNYITIDDSNATAYGVFSWENLGDALRFTLNPNIVLASAGLQTLSPITTYTITNITIPTNLTSANGVPVDTSTGIPNTGSFTTSPSGGVNPSVLFVYPSNTQTNVPYNGTQFRIIFSETMNTSIVPSSFTLTVQEISTGNSITIDSSNSSSYGAFSWGSTLNTDDTLLFTLHPNSTLIAGGLATMQPSSTYTIANLIPPYNLVDLNDNYNVEQTGLPSTSSFTTAGGI